MKINTVVFLITFFFISVVNADNYTYYEKIGKYYKFHKSPATWLDAKLKCTSENASLAMPKNDIEAEVLKNIFEKHPASSLEGASHPDYVLLGFHDIFSEKEFITDTGQLVSDFYFLNELVLRPKEILECEKQISNGDSIQYYFHSWATSQPDSGTAENCGSMYRNGKLNDIGCGAKYAFICQKSDKPDLPHRKYISGDPAYVLEPNSKKIFKLHLNPKTWIEARAICHSEGGQLAMIDSKEEEEFLVKILSDPKNKINYVNNPDFALLGFHDLFKEGNFFTVSGVQFSEAPYVNWIPGQPDNVGNEGCGSMNKDGRLNDYPCRVPATFFCEIDYSLIEFQNKNRAGTCEDESYIHYSNVGVSYKFFITPMKWLDAKMRCLEEGANLAMPKTYTEASILKRIFEKYPVSALSNTSDKNYILLDSHDMFLDGDFLTQNYNIQYFYHNWQSGEPGSGKSENCLAMNRDGTLHDYSCDLPFAFICQKEDISYLEMLKNRASAIYDPEYKYDSYSKKKFKLHLDPRDWATANTICHAEGGRLAIVESKKDEDILVSIISDPKNQLPSAHNKSLAFVGFHDIYEAGKYFTVDDRRLENVGYLNWADGETNQASKDQRCGIITKRGGIDDYSCTAMIQFICEKTPNV